MNCCALTGFIVILVSASVSGFQSSAAEIFALLGYCTLSMCVCLFSIVLKPYSGLIFKGYVSDLLNVLTHTLAEYSVQEDLRSQVCQLRMWRQEREHVKK